MNEFELRLPWVRCSCNGIFYSHFDRDCPLKKHLDPSCYTFDGHSCLRLHCSNPLDVVEQVYRVCASECGVLSDADDSRFSFCVGTGPIKMTCRGPFVEEYKKPDCPLSKDNSKFKWLGGNYLVTGYDVSFEGVWPQVALIRQICEKCKSQSKGK